MYIVLCSITRIDGTVHRNSSTFVYVWLVSELVCSILDTRCQFLMQLLRHKMSLQCIVCSIYHLHCLFAHDYCAILNLFPSELFVYLFIVRTHVQSYCPCPVQDRRYIDGNKFAEIYYWWQHLSRSMSSISIESNSRL